MVAAEASVSQPVSATPEPLDPPQAEAIDRTTSSGKPSRSAEARSCTPLATTPNVDDSQLRCCRLTQLSEVASSGNEPMAPSWSHSWHGVSPSRARGRSSAYRRSPRVCRNIHAQRRGSGAAVDPWASTSVDIPCGVCRGRYAVRGDSIGMTAMEGGPRGGIYGEQGQRRQETEDGCVQEPEGEATGQEGQEGSAQIVVVLTDRPAGL